MCIHMLNMLIAIMGDSFDKNNQEKKVRKRIFQLTFVVENWFLIEKKLKERNVVYIITAFFQTDEDHHHHDDLEKLSNRMEQVVNGLSDIKNILSRIERQ